MAIVLEQTINARYRYYQRAVGLLILATLVVLFVLLWTANRQFGLFVQTYRLHGFLDNVKNLQKATPVTLAGLKVGEVRDLTITDYHRIRVELLINKDYQSRIRGDSLAWVGTDVLGNARIDINMGTPGRPLLEDGAELPFQRAPDLDALLRQAQEQLTQVSAVLAHVEALAGELRKPEGALLGTLATFARMIQEFSTRSSGYLERIDVVLRDAAELSGQLTPLLRDLTMVSQEMSRSAADLAAVGARIRDGQGVLGGLTDSNSPLSRQIAVSARKLQAILTDMEKLARQLPGYGQRVERILQHAEQTTAHLVESSARVPGLLDRSRRVAEDVDDVVGGIKRNALLRAMAPTEPDRRPLLEAPRDLDWPIPAPTSP